MTIFLKTLKYDYMQNEYFFEKIVIFYEKNMTKKNLCTQHTFFISEFLLLLIWDHFTNYYHRILVYKEILCKIFPINFMKEFPSKLIGDLQQKILQKNSL